MQDSNNEPNGNIKQVSLFSQTCDAASFNPHTHADELEAVRNSCSSNGRINVVTCRDKELDIFLTEVNGLDMMNVNIKGTIFSLEQFVPVIPRGMFKVQAREVPYNVVGVVLNDILKKPLRLRAEYYTLPEDWEVDIEVLKNPVFKDKHVILFSSGQDVLVETVWWARHRKKFFESIAKIGFFGVTGMDFSLMPGECPVSHALNIKKSLCYSMELDQMGVFSIPHVYALNDHQRERWATWLKANPQIRLVTINAQLQRKENDGLRRLVDTINHLIANTTVNILIQGRGKGILSKVPQKDKGRLHFAASGPLKLATIRKDMSIAAHIQLFVSSLT